ncbi:MAG: hypothetical protein WCF95_06245 [bacterium]
MVGHLANFIGGSQMQPQTQPQTQQAQVTQAKPAVKKVGNPNPFNGNPFVTSKLNETSQTFGKNMPVQGGFFAGYHNGQPNIVGSKLFIEI